MVTQTAQDKLAHALAQLLPEQQERYAKDYFDRNPVDPEQLAGLLLDDLYDADDLVDMSHIELVHMLRVQLIEDDVLAHQIEWAEKRFGKDVSINVGWAAEDGCISSKIYSHGILTTWYNEEVGIVDEQFEPFGN